MQGKPSTESVTSDITAAYDGTRWGKHLRASENTDITVMAPGFGSDFVVLIEQNRRHSSATSSILRLRHGEIWSEDGMLEWDIGIFRVPKDLGKGRRLIFASIQGFRDPDTSLSNPGRIALKKAFLMSCPMICHLLV